MEPDGWRYAFLTPSLAVPAVWLALSGVRLWDVPLEELMCAVTFGL